MKQAERIEPTIGALRKVVLFADGQRVGLAELEVDARTQIEPVRRVGKCSFTEVPVAVPSGPMTTLAGLMASSTFSFCWVREKTLA